jgi:hypothetical protein
MPKAPIAVTRTATNFRNAGEYHDRGKQGRLNQPQLPQRGIDFPHVGPQLIRPLRSV